MDNPVLFISIVSILVLLASITILFLTIRERKKLFRTVAISEALVSDSNHPVVVITRAGKITYLNDAYADWLGRPRRDLIGRSIFLFTSYMQNEKVEEALSKGSAWSGVVGHKQRDGSIVDMFVCVHPIADRRGTIGEFVLFHPAPASTALSGGDTLATICMEHLPDGIVVVHNDMFVFANPAASAMLDAAAESDLVNRPYIGFVAPQSRSFMEDIYRQVLSEQTGIHHDDIKFLTKSEQVIDIEINAVRIEWHGGSAMLLTMRDVAERKEAEREQAQWLWEQELLNSVERQLVSTVDLNKVIDMIVHHARLLARADIAGVLTIDPEKESYRWLAMKGGEGAFPDAFMPLGPSAKTFYHESEPQSIHDFGRNPAYTPDEFPLFRDEKILTVLQFPFMRGSIVFGHLVIAYRKHYDFTDRMLKLLQSFTERATVAIMNAELYDQLRQQTKSLQQLFETRMQAQEEERRRIAAELHDSLGQLLTSIKLHIEVLQDSDIFKDTAEKSQMDDIRGLLDNAITEARNISYDLRPSILDDFGLIPALEVFCDKYSMRTNIKTSFQSHNLEARLRNKIETVLYRITQEALNNVQKHAEATEVNVQLIRTPTTINLVIEDNGKGFDPKKIDDARFVDAEGKINSGMGLVSMRERAATCNGTFTVDSTPGKGTDIIVEIPLSGVKENAEDTSHTG
jgi:PAS domain S-box-containing protein